MASIKMKLEKAAQKSGGDKYTGTFEGEALSFYIPQSISRPTGKPAPSIIVTLKVDIIA